MLAVSRRQVEDVCVCVCMRVSYTRSFAPCVQGLDNYFFVVVVARTDEILSYAQASIFVLTHHPSHMFISCKHKKLYILCVHPLWIVSMSQIPKVFIIIVLFWDQASSHHHLGDCCCCFCFCCCLLLLLLLVCSRHRIRPNFYQIKLIS